MMPYNAYLVMECASHPTPTSSRMHATEWPGATSRSARASGSAQAGSANGHRVRKTQPDGGFIGLGTSPSSSMRDFGASGSGSGAADSRAMV